MESLEDRRLLATLMVTNAADSGDGSLRQAILDANANPNVDANTPDVIEFNIGGSGSHTIQPLSPLPFLSDPVVINGYSQPGSQANTNPVGQGLNTMLMIELDGTSAGADGLVITASDSTVRGLAINRFPEYGIRILDADNNVIEGNFIGTTLLGDAGLGNGNSGVNVVRGTANVIGGTTAAARNLISANSLGHDFGDGNGVTISGGSGNMVQGNLIGTDVTGSGSELGNRQNGVLISSTSDSNLIGGTDSGAGNVISGNGQSGIDIRNGSVGNQIQGNFIGTDVSGTTALSNLEDGVVIQFGANNNNTIGGATAEARNIISGNGQNGVQVSGSGNEDTIIQHNYIGTDSTGSSAIGNGVIGPFGDGIELNGAVNSLIVTNVISGNLKEGVFIHSGATGNDLRGNFIGTDATGLAAIPNLDDGVDVRETTGNTIGGPATGDGNLISGNAGGGIEIAGWGAAIAVGDGATVTPGSSGFGGTLVQGNAIGLNMTGDAALPNLGSGVEIEFSDDNVLDSNIISGNAASGVLIHSGSTSNQLEENRIGTNVAGNAAVGNTLDGVVIDVNSTDNVIGGVTTDKRNIIAANGDDGIEIRGNANTVQGNFIGVDVTGSATLGSLGTGVEINGGALNLVGGIQPGATNVIGGNGFYGIALREPTAVDNRIEANVIGTDMTASIDLGNTGGGVLAQNSGSNTIGGIAVGAGNTIAFNDGNGVTILAIPDVSIQKGIIANSIFRNDGLGIDLGDDGVTPNDIGDGDIGANNLQNYPVITMVTSDVDTTISGALNSLADTNFRIDFFSNTAADPSGFGEGEVWIGTANVLTDGGDAIINETLTGVSVTPGSFLTATATNLNTGDTSEFSGAVVVAASACSLEVTTTTDGGPGSLREAIICANQTVEADTINLPSGNYFLDLVGSNEDASAFGDLDITRDLTIVGDGAGTTVIDASGLDIDAEGPQLGDRVFHVQGVIFNLQSVTVTGGNVFGTGGGLFNDGGSSVTLTNVVFDDNFAEGNGGGVFHTGGGTLDIFDSQFFHNCTVIVGDGGGLFNDNSQVNIVRSLFDGNATAHRGGAIYTFGVPGTNATLTIEDSTITRNGPVPLTLTKFGTTEGGGIYNDNDTVIIRRSTISDNEAIADGGGIFTTATTRLPVTLQVFDSTISGNRAGGEGGGIANQGDTVELTNVTISGNSASDTGGGIYQGVTGPTGRITVLNATITDNEAPQGSNLYNDESGSTIELQNTIVSAGRLGDNCFGTITSLGNNLEDTDSCGFNPSVLDDLIDTDPQLAPLQNNAGPTETHAPGFGSPAIDAADTAAAPEDDQRGVARVASADIGAVEFFAEISGVKYEDVHGNGIVDQADVPLSGWTIFLDGFDGSTANGAFDDGEPVSITDDDGAYRFSVPAAGTYLVTELVQDEWVATGDVQQMVELTEAQVAEVNFLNAVPGSIHGVKFEDVNRNGVRDEVAAIIEFDWTVVTSVDPGTFALFPNLASGGLTTVNTHLNGVAGPVSRIQGVGPIEGFIDQPGDITYAMNAVTAPFPTAPALELDPATFDDGDNLDGISSHTYVPMTGNNNQLEILRNGVVEAVGDMRFVTINTVVIEVTPGNLELTSTGFGEFVLTGVPTGADPTIHDTLVDRAGGTTIKFSLTEFSLLGDESNLPEGTINSASGGLTNLAAVDPEPVIAGVEFKLTGTDGLGNPVPADVVAITNDQGEFEFTGLNPSGAGGYTVTETVDGFAPTTSFSYTTDLLSRQELVALPGQAMLRTVERVSVSNDGIQADNESSKSAISADGRFVVFASEASNLVPGDTNGSGDVFVFDRDSGTIERVSVDNAGIQGNDGSFDPSISADGRFVSFDSEATNLVPGDTNDRQDIFVVDRETRLIERASVNNSGMQADGDSNSPRLSADGRFVAFLSSATNLVPGDTNNRPDVFVFDRQTDMIQRVSVNASGIQGDEFTGEPSISADGRYVAFDSSSTNLVPGDTEGRRDVFVVDRLTGAIERVSVNEDGIAGDSGSFDPSISEDGRYVAFESSSTNLVPGDTNNQSDVFVVDRQTNMIERISVDNAGIQGDNRSGNPFITADGRYVAFVSYATNLVPEDTNNDQDVFAFDRQTDTIERASVDSVGTESDGLSSQPSISADGRFMVFDSTATNLVPGDTNGTVDTFLSPISPLRTEIVIGDPLTFGNCSLVVTTAEDTLSATDGVTSLREAILCANDVANIDRDGDSVPDPDPISFAIPGTGVQTINVGSTGMGQLPTITEAVIIDGYTQDAATPNTSDDAVPNTDPLAFNGTLLIELNGENAGDIANGLEIISGGSTIRGLIINRFQGQLVGIDDFDGGRAIRLNGAGGNVIEGNIVGLDPSGTIDVGNASTGIDVESANNTIGGLTPAARNLIAGNRTAIALDGPAATGNTVVGNLLGTNATGTAGIDLATLGIAIYDATDNTIGGTTAGARNVISGLGIGLIIAADEQPATGNKVQGNYIGTDLTGAVDVGNDLGIIINGSNNTVGGTEDGAGNVISGNQVSGVLIGDNITTVIENRVQGNLIGVDATDSNALANGDGAGNFDEIAARLNQASLESSGESLNVTEAMLEEVAGGVAIAGASMTTVGGTEEGAGNVISGNIGPGVVLSNIAEGNNIQGNFIGTDGTGAVPRGNSTHGVLLLDASIRTTIGGDVAGAGNVISDNGQDGIHITGFDSDQNRVQGNLIGTTGDGTASLGNSGHGVFIGGGAFNNLVGGTTVAARNIISGNSASGVTLSLASDITVQGNFIGTDVTGTVGLGNAQNGILVSSSSGTIIGGTEPGSRNLISGNAENGIDLDNRSAGSQIQGNFIGTDLAGMTALANGQHGVEVRFSSGNTIGGTTAEARNVISGNTLRGVAISETSDNVVSGNYIGIDVTGMVALGNLMGGIEIEGSATDNIIGGSVPGSGNVIAGNLGPGVLISVDEAIDNTLQGNFIGTDSSGMLDLGNTGAGVLIDEATHNTIEDNTIAFNGIGSLSTGVAILSGTRNAIRRNSMFQNAGLGIDLSNDGVTPNDPGDTDTGPNDLLNFPVLELATVDNGDLTISGFARPGSEIEFFIADPDPSGFGEGKTFLVLQTEGSSDDDDATTDTYGPGLVNGLDQGTDTTNRFSFVIPIAALPVSVGDGTVLTATATDASGNTSEFSNAIEVAGAEVDQADLSLAKIVDNARPNVGDEVTFTVTLSNEGPDEATGIAVTDVLPAGLMFLDASHDSYNRETGIWTVDTLPFDETETLTITALVTAADAATNVAEVTAVDQTDPDSTPGNNVPSEDDQASVIVTPQVADLSIDKQVDKTTTTPGETVTFTVTLTNVGPDQATNIQVADVIPAGLASESVIVTPSVNTRYADGVWSLDSLAAETGIATLTIVGQIVANGTTITNTAEVIAVDQADPDSTNNLASAMVTIVQPQAAADLSLSKMVDDARPNVGDEVTFTVTLNNQGPDAATGVRVTDLLPNGLMFAASSDDGYDRATGVWTVGTLAVDQSQTLMITALVTAVGATTNLAEVTASDQPDSDSSDNQASVNVSPQFADLSLVKTVDNSSATSGENVTFTIAVNNAGPDAATTVTVADKLPAGLDFINATPSVGSYDNESGIWTIGQVNAGATETLDIRAAIRGDGPVTNVAQVASSDQFDPDSNPGNNVEGEDDQFSAGVGACLTGGPLTVGMNRLVYSCVTPGGFAAFVMGTQTGRHFFDKWGTTVDIADPSVPAIGVGNIDGVATVLVELTEQHLNRELMFQAFEMLPNRKLSNMLTLQTSDDLLGMPLRTDELGAGGKSLSAESLPALTDAAIARWEATGLSAADSNLLRSLDVRISDLPGDQLASAHGHFILLDSTAAGHGWFVDSTLNDDAEFSNTGEGALSATSRVATGHIDALTAIMHEMGHALGQDDTSDGSSSDLMSRSLPVGVRRLPTSIYDPLDANRDGKVSALDALVIINQLAREQSSGQATGESRTGNLDQAIGGYDVNGDGKISALDALNVINDLSRSKLVAAESQSVSSVDTVVLHHPDISPIDDDGIDDDLLQLLADDQINALLEQ